ncbi:MAG: hypothetical protein JWN60_1028 [Acidobacteria bacterium]|jgi:hypothetical protein|nr:hypothetical protein [Acidobacteriota bacterium]
MVQETNREAERDTIRRKDEELTGSDIPGGTGEISDEDINAIDEDLAGKPTGQDHSTENYGESMPDGGVGGVQNHSDPTSDIARIND